MAENASASHGRETRQSLNRRILRNTTLNIFVLVVVCCVIMALSMQSLATVCSPWPDNQPKPWKPISTCWQTG